ncbi:hypothetical protein INT47_002870 [Mucor saturninus]|uniref:Uncharacterized protein n=1 Tax=Mucor saturninus TaxID=64648 RepID=A0A8H7UV48_9FUNG|nr:hypothetical protein INT47_002870 [Mucor saturninus]
MNLKISRLHHSTSFAVMFNRRAIDFENYTNVDHNWDNSVITPELVSAQYHKTNKFNIPALSKRIQLTQEKDNARLLKHHHIIHKKFPIGRQVMIRNVMKTGKTDPNFIGPFTIQNYATNGFYVLVD